MKINDIKICIDNKDDKYQVNDTDFINCINKNAENNKVNSVIKDAKSKQVNDELTKITNNLLTTEINHTNSLFNAIYKIFGNIDNDNLEPYINGQSKNTNYFDTYMYFVFKGGNTIKYWVNKTYLEEMNDLAIDLEEILSTKISIHENESINAYSDFDFSLYIDFEKNKKDYKEIVSDIGNKLLLLRKEIDPIIKDSSLTYFNNDTNYDLLKKLYEYIILKNKIEPKNIDFKFISECDDFILTRKNDDNMMYTRKVNEKLIVSFNNLIQFDTTDFDLFRIKLGIVAKYSDPDAYVDPDAYAFADTVDVDVDVQDYSHNFKSEIFDLTILRENDSALKIFIKNISNYTNIIHFIFNNIIIPVRIYNIKYILIDLLTMLFEQSIVPWLNLKYEKRLIRFAFMTSLYNQENFDIDNSPETNNELAFGIFNLLNILSIINLLNLLTSASNHEEIYYNIIIFKFFIETNLFVINNNNLSEDTDLKQIINGENDYDNLDNYKKYKYNPNKYFCFIILVFIRKIFIEIDVLWYKDIINDQTELDFDNIKDLLKTLLKTYIFYFLISTFTLIHIKTLFDNYLVNRFDLSEIFHDINGGFKYTDSLKKSDQKTDSLKKLDHKSESTYTLKKLTLKQLTYYKLKNNLLKLHEINGYFEDVKHEYLLNSNMEPEIIRKIKDKKNIKKVFYILKDILQLKTKDQEYY